jgi:Arc/MetJ-type ribon-helix-helix transcriptional regulator
VRTPRSESRADKFLGVRLTPEELGHLDTWRASHGNASRSEAVRALLRAPDQVATSRAPELPISLRHKLEEIVEDGWAASEDGALTLVLTLGLTELSKLHLDRLPELRKHARDQSSKSHARRRVDREGRGLLER